MGGGTLKVKVVNGRELRNKEKTSKSDPYCSIQAGDQKVTTKTKDNTLDPDWDEDLVLNVPGLCILLYFKFVVGNYSIPFFHQTVDSTIFQAAFSISFISSRQCTNIDKESSLSLDEQAPRQLLQQKMI